MVKSRLLPPLIALAALMLVVSGTLAAVLVSGGDDEPGPANQAAVAGDATQEPSPANSRAQPTATPVVEIPAALRARFEALPEKLRAETLKAYAAGTINDEVLASIIEDYENRNTSVRVGSVVSTSADSISIEVYTTGERANLEINDNTVIRRAQRDIAPTDLQVDELIMVVSMDQGRTAFSIDAFGVAAP